jgi:hypothetical protein
MTLACILLFVAGHLHRDGYPAWKDMLARLVGTPFEFVYHLSTQLARIFGAVLCGLGALMVHDCTMALAVGAAILAGFYFDMKHGAGQGATTWDDAGFLALSGFTSLIPLALVAIWFHGEPAAMLVLAGFTKPPIWFGWWSLEGHHGEGRMTRLWSWLMPTRLAAMTFGGVIGAAVALL